MHIVRGEDGLSQGNLGKRLSWLTPFAPLALTADIGYIRVLNLRIIGAITT